VDNVGCLHRGASGRQGPAGTVLGAGIAGLRADRLVRRHGTRPTLLGRLRGSSGNRLGSSVGSTRLSRSQRGELVRGWHATGLQPGAIRVTTRSDTPDAFEQRPALDEWVGGCCWLRSPRCSSGLLESNAVRADAFRQFADRAVTISTTMDARVTSGHLGAPGVGSRVQRRGWLRVGCRAVRRPSERVGFPGGRLGYAR
jgi:hypothetical protein